ncbi:SH3 and multiple ankyrin repeat domains protein 2 [Orbilia brochopaga]|uniref:SH3 and multiple ankyrin repeat domains protein 2 n=1 Tax=Orbilia brochopaga TaxID=3140254 RepID=A0AAV9TXN9_9PEZI
MATKKQLPADAFTVGIIYAKPLEMTAITVMVDEFYLPVTLQTGDTNEYVLGRIGDQNVAIAGPARGKQGKVSVASVVARIPQTFRNIKVGLLVGIGGGVPYPEKEDVRLGDVVIGAPEYTPAIIQYDLGKQYTDGTEIKRTLNKPPDLLLRVVNNVYDEYQRAMEGEDFFAVHLKRFERFPRLRNLYRRPTAPDRLFRADFEHEDSASSCESHDPAYEIQRHKRDEGTINMHFGTILSGDMVMKSGKIRDELSGRYHRALCFEMEAAGVVDDFPCLVVRGICDYADSHKNKAWQEFAAATAACFAREVLVSMAKRALDGLEAAGKGANTVDIKISAEQNSGIMMGQNTGNISFKSR